MTNKYIACKCSELGPLPINLEGLQKRILNSMKFNRFYAVLATIETPRQMALRKCRVCNKYYQESPCGQGFNRQHYLYEVPAIDAERWQANPYSDPYEQIVTSVEARTAGL